VSSRPKTLKLRQWSGVEPDVTVTSGLFAVAGPWNHANCPCRGETSRTFECHER
jgi:hypothetical protein